MIGYRDNSLFGDGITDPLAVTYYELNTLGNVDVPDYILDHYASHLLTDEVAYLKELSENIDDIDEVDEWFYGQIIQKVIGNRNFCLWLCKSKQDVYDSYIGIMPQCKETFEEAKEHIEAYDIPDDAIILSDGGREGTLYVWKN